MMKDLPFLHFRNLHWQLVPTTGKENEPDSTVPVGHGLFACMGQMGRHLTLPPRRHSHRSSQSLVCVSPTSICLLSIVHG